MNELYISDCWIYFKTDKNTYQGTVTRPAFYNYDADVPDWEVETTNGYCNEHSLYVYA